MIGQEDIFTYADTNSTTLTNTFIIMTNTIILTSEEHGCAYSIDSEGVLFYTPMFTDNKVDTGDWNEVDHMAMLGEEQSIQDEINNVHEQLITLNKAVGWYYQS